MGFSGKGGARRTSSFPAESNFKAQSRKEKSRKKYRGVGPRATRQDVQEEIAENEAGRQSWKREEEEEEDEEVESTAWQEKQERRWPIEKRNNCIEARQQSRKPSRGFGVEGGTGSVGGDRSESKWRNGAERDEERKRCQERQTKTQDGDDDNDDEQRDEQKPIYLKVGIFPQ